jgi:hypothetical protein
MNLTCSAKHPTGHHCMNCGDAVHGPGFGCCYLWCERDKGIVTVTLKEVTDLDKGLENSVSAVICLICTSSTITHAHASFIN